MSFKSEIKDPYWINLEKQKLTRNPCDLPQTKLRREKTGVWQNIMKAGAFTAKYHKLGGLKQVCYLTALGARSLRSTCWQGCEPSETYGREFPLAFQLQLLTRNPWHSFTWRLHHSNLCLQQHLDTTIFLRGGLPRFPSSSKGTRHIGLLPQLDHILKDYF